MQFHTITDSHDQYEQPLEDLTETLRLMGQPYPMLLGTDNPAGDKDFFLRALPSLLKAQQAFNGETPEDAAPTDAAPTDTAPTDAAPTDAATTDAAQTWSATTDPATTDSATTDAATTDVTMTDAAQAVTATALGTGQVLPIDIACVKLCSKHLEIEAAVLSFRDELLGLSPEPVVGFDAEWDTVRNGRGDIIGKKGRVALIILSALVAPSKYKTLLLRTYDKATLPASLLNFLVDQRFKFTGRCIGQDLAKVSKDFLCEEVHATTLWCDLGSLARSRDIFPTGNCQLGEIVLASTGYSLPKDPNVRCSV